MTKSLEQAIGHATRNREALDRRNLRNLSTSSGFQQQSFYRVESSDQGPEFFGSDLWRVPQGEGVNLPHELARAILGAIPHAEENARMSIRYARVAFIRYRFVQMIQNPLGFPARNRDTGHACERDAVRTVTHVPALCCEEAA